MRDYPNREDKLIHTYNSEIEGITYLESVINIKPIKNEQYNQRLSRLINSGIELSICQYSLGHEFKAIRETVEQTITYYSRMDDDWSAYPASVYVLVKLASMAILIDVSDKAWGQLVDKWLKSGSYGHLLAKLLSYRNVNLEQGPDVRVNKSFGPLLTLSNLDDDSEFLEELKTYSKKWYTRHKSLHWYNSHDSENSLYFGYWAIEAAAIAKIRGLNLVDTKFGEYFPYGFFDLPEQLSKKKLIKPN